MPRFSRDGHALFQCTLPGDESEAELDIHVTDEGVVFDVWQGDECVRTGCLFVDDIVRDHTMAAPFYATIKLPRCWRRLLDTVFDDLKVQLLGRSVEVLSEKHEHADDDPLPYYDEIRTQSVEFSNGAIARVDLCSGQSNYYGGCTLYSRDGNILHEDNDAIESFDGPIEMQGGDGETYIVTIEWEGVDPYEPIQSCTSRSRR